MIRLLDLPGVSVVEARITQNELIGHRTDHELAHMIDALHWKVFGIEGNPAFHFEWTYDPEDDDLDDRTYWAKAGWDVTDGEGNVLRCLDALANALVCVTFGYAGRSMLEIEADLWKQHQAANSNVDPMRTQRDRSYLDFGRRRGRA